MQLAEVIEEFWDSRLEEIHTAFAAVVQSYSGHTTRLVTVIPVTNHMLINGRILHAIPIADIPVMFPSSQAGSFVFPLKKGDIVMVIVNETALGNWLAGKGLICDPEHSGRFSKGDGVAIPGLWPSLSQVKPKVSVPDSSAEMKFNGASVEFKKDGSLKFTGDVEIVGKLKASGDLEVGGAAEISGTTTASDFATAILAFSTHVHACTAPGSPSGPPTGPPAPPAP